MFRIFCDNFLNILFIHHHGLAQNKARALMTFKLQTFWLENIASYRAELDEADKRTVPHVDTHMMHWQCPP